MYAAWYETIGAAQDVLNIGEVDVPEVMLGQVRVKVFASAIGNIILDLAASDT